MPGPSPTPGLGNFPSFILMKRHVAYEMDEIYRYVHVALQSANQSINIQRLIAENTNPSLTSLVCSVIDPQEL